MKFSNATTYTTPLVLFTVIWFFSCNRAADAKTPEYASTHAGDLREDNALEVKLRWCPPGKFQMGSPESEPDRQKVEGPVSVTFSNGFWIGQYEVTQGQWMSIMSTTPAQQKAKITKPSYGYNYGTSSFGEGPQYPMYYVAHGECDDFCKRLTKKERDAERLPKDCIYRLPTEAEWEYACRAGTTTATSVGHSLGSDQANFNGTAPYNGAKVGPFRKTTLKVGSFKPNSWNLYDMHGNVSEWCQDWNVDQLKGGQDPVVLDEPRVPQRSLRGGSWESSGRYCRSAYRGDSGPGIRCEFYGFRIVLGKEVR